MSLFLTGTELLEIRKANRDPRFSNLYWALLNRAQRHAAQPGMRDENTTTDWWHHAYEYISETALAHAIKPDPSLGAWLRAVTMEIARRPEDDWIGPTFRIRQQPPVGHLETTHLSLAVALALDLAPEVFTEAERAELVRVLQTRAIPLCRGWMTANRHLANWRCILLAGAAVAAAVAEDKDTLDWARREYDLCLNVVQPDGSYAESLQYASYCFFGLMMTREALARSAPEKAVDLPIAPYAKAVLWFVYSHLYRKPVEGFGGAPMPRSINFNDSAAIGGPMPDLLLHIAAHAPPELAREAGLARWLFDDLYVDDP
ncbi:MAG: heparinase, partial [Kiritimatiellia bacterium]|nr:heparinase [Kiritimatiellia bacterium]